MDSFLFSALIMGFAGSFHCIGMCGPIALALPPGDTRKSFIYGRLLYNAGRIVTYSIIGGITGLIGYSAAVSGFQRELSIFSGILIILFVLFIAGSSYFSRAGSTLTRATSSIKKKFRMLFGKRSYLSLFSIGLLNGILPCGLVYLAAIAAMSTGSYTDGIIYMALFGAGTFPAMLAISMVGPLTGGKWKRIMNRSAPYVAILVGVLLIWRGVMTKDDACCKDHSAVQITKID